MTIEKLMSEYKGLIDQAMELRLTIRTIKEQLALGGTPDWQRRAERALQYKSRELVRIKEQQRCYRAALRHVGKELALSSN